MILGVFNLKSDIGAKQAADVTYTFMSSPTIDIVCLSFPTDSYISMITRDKNSLGDTILYLPVFRDLRRLSKELLYYRVHRHHGPRNYTQQLFPVTWTDTSCSLVFSSYDHTSPGPHPILQGVWSMRGHFEI